MICEGTEKNINYVLLFLAAQLSYRIMQIGKNTCSLGPSINVYWVRDVVGREIVNIFSSISLNIRFKCAKQPTHGDDSFVCPQLNFRLKI